MTSRRGVAAGSYRCHWSLWRQHPCPKLFTKETWDVPSRRHRKTKGNGSQRIRCKIPVHLLLHPFILQTIGGKEERLEKHLAEEKGGGKRSEGEKKHDCFLKERSVLKHSTVTWRKNWLSVSCSHWCPFCSFFFSTVAFLHFCLIHIDENVSLFNKRRHSG